MSKVCVNVQQKDGPRLRDPWVCHWIPDVAWPHFPFPPPDNPHPERGPSPEPWMSGLGIAPETVRDLQLLAALHNTAAQLTDRARAVVQEVVRAQVGALNLPGELQVHL